MLKTLLILLLLTTTAYADDLSDWADTVYENQRGINDAKPNSVCTRDNTVRNVVRNVRDSVSTETPGDSDKFPCHNDNFRVTHVVRGDGRVT